MDHDPRPLIRAMVYQDEDAMLVHLDIYSNPNTRFQVSCHVRTWGWECKLTLLAAVEIAAWDFPTILFVLVKNAGINPNEPYVIDDFT